MTDTTDDFHRLCDGWQETLSYTPLELHAAKAKLNHEHAAAAVERFRFESWLGSLREKVDRDEAAATCAWARAVVQDGVAAMVPLRKGGA